jgi:NodT family efflux transporter outer membrane factor (OMF) lipoprotein
MKTLPALVFLVSTGCVAVGPDYVRPEIPMPEKWSSDLGGSFGGAQRDPALWWKRFGDPILEELIARAARGSLDLKSALSRVEEARALLGVARGERLPKLDASASYTRSRQSSEASLGGKTLGSIVSVQDVDTYTLGLGAGWELDLFGRLRRAVEASRAGLQAGFEDLGAVLVSLRADVALTYIEIRSLQSRINIAEKNVQAQKESQSIVQKRHRAGTAPGLDLAQADANVAATEATLPKLKTQLALAKHRLCLLLGEQPGALDSLLGRAVSIPQAWDEFGLGIPADLLRQRPDVRRAERLLAAQTARVGIATSDLYPRLSLSGFFGFSAQSPENLLQAPSRLFQIGPSLVWNLFAGGSIRSNIEVQEARVQQAYLAYRKTVLKALEEVENALTSYRLEKERNRSLQKAVEAYRRVHHFSMDLYKGGKADFQNVLDAQRQLLGFEDQLAASDAALAGQLVLLYRALGGGWVLPAGMSEKRKNEKGPQAQDQETGKEGKQ